MKNIKKLLAVLLAALLCVSVTACANNSSSSTAVATLETSSTASEGETAESTDKDPAGYDDDIQGLCKYLEDCKAAAGEKVQMSYQNNTLKLYSQQLKTNFGRLNNYIRFYL